MADAAGLLCSVLELCRVAVVAGALWLLQALEFLLPDVFAPRKDLAGRLVVVTGAGSGLGRLLAVKFGRLGARLALLDDNDASNNETADLVRTVAGADAAAYTCDLSKRKDLYRVTDAIKSQLGEVDIVVNNASLFISKPFFETSDEEINRSMAVNHLAHCWVAHAFLHEMMEKNQGHIVTIASAAGLLATNNLSAYTAAKHAAVGFHRALDMELDAMGVDNVKTTLICPYYIKSEKTEGLKTKFNWLLPILEPEDAANRIMEAVLRNRKFLGMPCAINIFFALQSLMPVNVAHYVARCFGAIRATDSRTKKTSE